MSETIQLEISGTPYLIETNINRFTWADMQSPEKCRDMYATIYRVENGKRPVWQMEYKGSTAITDAILSIGDVVGEPVAHRIRRIENESPRENP